MASNVRSVDPAVPDYVASAQPVPKANRIPWYKSTAQTYAGIMLWFVFWTSVTVGGGTPGGTLVQGLGPAFVGLIAAALFCYAFYYLAPGMLGLKTGLPLYIVGTSTYGVTGGFIMPGFLMGILQFGWLGVNAYFSALLTVRSIRGRRGFDTPRRSRGHLGNRCSLRGAEGNSVCGSRGHVFPAHSVDNPDRAHGRFVRRHQKF